MHVCARDDGLFTLEERRAQHQLRHDAARRPHVHAPRVDSGPEEQLRTPIPTAQGTRDETGAMSHGGFLRHVPPGEEKQHGRRQTHRTW
jgi:hypothetical protein